jgi:signal transduction histidine kinase/CheY-like chemotaxis protein
MERIWEWRRLFGGSLRHRLTILIAVAFVPAILAAFGNIVEEHRHQLSRAQDAAFQFARLAAMKEDQSNEGTRRLLWAMSVLPEITGGDPDACEQRLNAILQEYTQYSTLSVMLPNGETKCSTRIGSRGLNVLQRDYFQRVLMNREFSVGDFQIGQVSKIPIIGFGYPKFDENGNLALVTYASITVSWLSAADAIFRSQLPPDSMVTMLDSKSVVTAQQPNVGEAGKPLPPELLNHLVGESGIFQETPADGIARVYAYTTVPNLPDRSRKVLVGIPVPHAFADSRLWVSLAVTILLIGLVFLAVWFGTDWFVVRDVRVLIEAAKKLAAGDLTARTGISDSDEIGQLAFAFDTMATSLEKQSRERQKAEESLRLKLEHERELQERLRHAQRLEAVGRLAGGVAHDFNNILTIISGYNQILIAEEESPKKRNALETVQKATDRAATLTRQLLAFSRKQVLQPKIFNLYDLVASLVRMLPRLIGEDIRLSTVGESKQAIVKADPGQIEQVIMNLVVNARDAMPTGGELVIGTSVVDITETTIDNQHDIVAGSYVCLKVRDTGHGMSEEVLAKIFEPFFTTKEPGKGTGLGLATVYGIVKQSGGFVKVRSRCGQGTMFEVYIPRATESSAATAADPRSGANSGRNNGSRILLVEDEVEVRKLVCSLLERDGHHVVQAGNGVKALEIIRTAQTAFDLLITDVIMPEMSGPEFAARAAEIYPSLPVLYMSGYTDDFIVHHGMTDKGLSFIEKPFTADALKAKIRDVLAASKQAPAEVS